MAGQMVHVEIPAGDTQKARALATATSPTSGPWPSWSPPQLPLGNVESPSLGTAPATMRLMLPP